MIDLDNLKVTASAFAGLIVGLVIVWLLIW